MDGLDSRDQIYVIAGLFANRRSTPVVDEWFALRYRDGLFVGRMTMEELLALTKFDRDNLPNVGGLPEAAVSQAQVLVPDAVERAQSVMAENYRTYVQRIAAFCNL